MVSQSTGVQVGNQIPAGTMAQQPAPFIDYSQGPYANSGVQQFLQTMLPRWNTQWEDPGMQGGYVNPSGAAVTLGNVKNLTQKAIDDFSTQVQAVAGRAPTADEITQFFTSQMIPMASQSQPAGYDPIHPQDITSAIQQYVPTAFSKPIQDYQTQQQTDSLQKNLGTGQGLIDQSMQSFIQKMTDPQSSMYQNFSGNMNNMGITPGSGAFQSGLGTAIGNQEGSLQSALMQGLGFPTLAGIQGLAGQANQNLQGSAPMAQQNLTTQQNQLGDWGREIAMAQYLSNQGQPSGLEKGVGMASSLLGAGGNAAQGYGSARQGTAASYVCREMIKQGLLRESDLDDLHVHLVSAVPYKGRAVWLYANRGQAVVDRANQMGLSWEAWKPYFFDEVMAEKDPIKALNLYTEAFRALTLQVHPAMWDERARRTSVWDSLPFLVPLLVFKRYRQAIVDAVHRKMLFILDKPVEVA